MIDATDDPVNNIDPLGLCWPSFACVVEHAVGAAATRTWNDTGGKVVSLIHSHTIGLCVNASAGFGPFGTASGCLAFVGGKFTLIGTAGGGGASPTASLTGGLLFSNARTPKQLRGSFAFAGGSGDLGLSLGEEGSIGNTNNNPSCNHGIWENQVTAGVGLDLPIPFETHGGSRYTWTWTP